MLRSFALLDGNLDDIQVGTFTYDTDTRRFRMTIADNIPMADLPLSLEGFASRGKYELSHEDALRWVNGRICPPGRHNIREILRDNGLEKYDEFDLLLVSNAKCDKDELYFRNESDH